MKIIRSVRTRRITPIPKETTAGEIEPTRKPGGNIIDSQMANLFRIAAEPSP